MNCCDQSPPQQQAEPVTWTLTETLNKRETTTRGYLWFSNPQNSSWTPLYTTSPQRQWVGLTDEEIDAIDEANWDADDKSWGIHSFARAIENKLKEKNT